MLSSDVKSLSWREKLILFIIWSFAIKFRLMTSVNWFSPDIAICFQKVIFWNWENLTNNSFPFLLKATLLGYCFNVNWGVAKTIKVTNDTTLLPNLHSQLSFRDSLRNSERKICFRIILLPFSWYYFPYGCNFTVYYYHRIII